MTARWLFGNEEWAVVDIDAGRCLCATCRKLDWNYPTEGYQLRLPLGSGDRPESIPLPDFDAPAVTAADVRAPKGRPVETRARGRKQPEPAHV